jgi:hypothetical protein
MNAPVQMKALLIAQDDCECSCMRIQSMSANPGTAGGEQAETGLAVLVD